MSHKEGAERAWARGSPCLLQPVNSSRQRNQASRWVVRRNKSPADEGHLGGMKKAPAAALVKTNSWDTHPRDLAQRRARC